MSKLMNEDPAGALVEFERLVTLQPYAISAYVARSRAKEALRDYPGAIADESHAIDLNRDDPTSYQRRAISEMLARRWTDALNDLRKASEKPDTTDPYTPIFLWLTRVRLDQKAAADRDFAAFVDARPEFGAPVGWVQHVDRFLLGRETESDFLDAASAEEASAIEQLGSSQQALPGSTPSSHFKIPSRIGYRCEAMFYCGVMRRLAGDKAAAAEQFRQCLATKRTRFAEYYLAAEELREMEH